MCCLKEAHFIFCGTNKSKLKDTNRLKVKGWLKIDNAHSSKEYGYPLISDKIDLKTKRCCQYSDKV